MFTNMSKTALGVLLALAAYFFYTAGDKPVKDVGHRVGVFEIGLFVLSFARLPGIFVIFAKSPRETWGKAIRFVHHTFYRAPPRSFNRSCGIIWERHHLSWRFLLYVVYTRCKLIEPLDQTSRHSSRLDQSTASIFSAIFPSHCTALVKYAKLHLVHFGSFGAFSHPLLIKTSVSLM